MNSIFFVALFALFALFAIAKSLFTFAKHSKAIFEAAIFAWYTAFPMPAKLRLRFILNEYANARSRLRRIKPG
jgi:hypothetical protein